MRFLMFILIVFFMIVFVSAQTIDFQKPIANSDDAFSILTNPAGLGTNRGMQLLYANGYNKDEFTKLYTFALNLGNLGFAYQENSEDGINFKRYSLGTGFKLNRMLKMGFSYSWNSSGFLADGLSMGLLFRPTNSLSIGLNGNFLNEPQTKKADYQAGIAFRPFGNHYTLSADAFLSRDDGTDYFEEIDWRINLETEPFDGIVLRGSYSEDYFGLGVGLAFRFGSIGSQNIFDSSDKLDRGSLYIQSSSQYFRSIFDSPKPKFIHFKLEGSVIEQNRGWGIFASRQLTIYQFGQIIQKMKEDNEVKGLLLDIARISAGYGKMQELISILHDFRKAGKELIVYAENIGTREYLLASEADRIYMHPAGNLNLTGLQFTSMFLKGTLDKLGIVAELEHIKEYKSASEMFTRDSMSVYQREVINSVADQYFQDIVAELSNKREIDEDKLKEIINNAPYLAEEAKELALVDELYYRDELRDMFKEDEHKNNLISYRMYSFLKPYEYDWEVEPAEKIAIVYATGSIMSGDNHDDFLMGKIMGSNTIATAIRSARENSSIKAIILRIDSGGGSAFATEEIWREVALTTTGENKKPFIVSMSDMAASGGYFIACAADEIYANPATATGSIGIFSGKFNLSGLFDKLGIRFQHIKRGENAGLYTSTRGFTEKERERMIHTMEGGYDRFISRVAEGRDMTKEEVNEIGRGRVWTGKQGVEKGIVDKLGGLYDTIKAAEEKAGIEAGEEYSILLLPEYSFTWPFNNNDFVADAKIVENLPMEIKQVLYRGYRLQAFKDEPYLYLMPYDFIIE